MFTFQLSSIHRGFFPLAFSIKPRKNDSSFFFSSANCSIRFKCTRNHLLFTCKCGETLFFFFFWVFRKNNIYSADLREREKPALIHNDALYVVILFFKILSFISCVDDSSILVFLFFSYVFATFFFSSYCLFPLPLFFFFSLVLWGHTVSFPGSFS